VFRSLQLLFVSRDSGLVFSEPQVRVPPRIEQQWSGRGSVNASATYRR
jgi:hypothetical protein